MLIIRREQSYVLSQYTLEQFHNEMEKHLKKQFPEKIDEMNDEQLRELIVQGVEEAEGYGVTDDNDVKRYLEYLVRYGRDLGGSPETKWASRFLRNEDLNGTEKMNEIDDHFLFVITLGK